MLNHEELIKLVDQSIKLDEIQKPHLTPIDIQDKNLKKDFVEWIKALESGEYNQATEALYRRNEDKTYGYCCLGVACYIGGFANEDMDESEEPQNLRTLDKTPSNKFMEILMNPTKDFTDLYTTKLQQILINLNDDVGASFSFIAKVLRAKYKIYE